MQDKIECRLFIDDEQNRRRRREKIASAVAAILITFFIVIMLNVAIMKHRLNQEKEKQATEWTQE